MRIGLMMGALGDPGLNTRLLAASRRYIGNDVTVEHLRLVDLPPFVPSGNVPAPAAVFRRDLSTLDGVVIFVTQSLNGVTGTIKNALDWVSMPSSALDRKPVAIAGLTRHPSSTFAALQQVRSALTPLDAVVMRQPEYSLEVAPEFFGDNDAIVDVQLADELATFLHAARGFIAHQVRVSEVETGPQSPLAGMPAPVTGGTPRAGLTGSFSGSLANPRRFRA